MVREVYYPIADATFEGRGPLFLRNGIGTADSSRDGEAVPVLSKPIS